MQRSEMRRAAARAAGVLGVALAVAGADASAQQVVDLPGQDTRLDPSLETVFRVGSMAGADWETFGDLAGVAFDAQGRLYIFDRQSSRVVVTDGRGRLVRTVGKEGDGPGELRAPVGFTVLRDGTIVIADMGHRAYQLFGPDGAFQRMVSFGGDATTFRLGEMSPDPRGGAIFSGGGNTVVSISAGPGQRPELPRGRPVERIGLAGASAAATTVVQAWQPPRPEARPQTLSGGGARIQMAAMAMPRTFEPGLLVGPLPDGGLAYSDSTAYAIRVTGPDGRPQRVLRRPLSPRPVTPAMQEAEKKRRLDDMDAGRGPRMRIMTSGPGGGGAQPISQDAIREMMRGQIEQMEFYPELPVLLNLKTGWGGKIWAVRRGQRPTDAGPMDVLTPAGQYLGTIAPAAMSLPAAFGPEGLVAFIERDEFDVPTVVVKRLPANLR